MRNINLNANTTGFRAYYVIKITVMIMMISIRAATIPTAIPATLSPPPDGSPD